MKLHIGFKLLDNPNVYYYIAFPSLALIENEEWHSMAMGKILGHFGRENLSTLYVTANGPQDLETLEFNGLTVIETMCNRPRLNRKYDFDMSVNENFSELVRVIAAGPQPPKVKEPREPKKPREPKPPRERKPKNPDRHHRIADAIIKRIAKRAESGDQAAIAANRALADALPTKLNR